MSDSASKKLDTKLEVVSDRKAPQPLGTEDVSERRHIRQQDERLLNSWWRETIWMLLAYGLLVASCYLLTTFNDQHPPLWKYGLSINTVLAIVSTLIRVSLTAIVESCTTFVQRITINLIYNRYQPVKVDTIQAA
jgi:Protein of unknown function (DUF3176)